MCVGKWWLGREEQLTRKIESSSFKINLAQMLKKVTSIRHDISKLHCLEGEGRTFTHKANLVGCAC